MIKRRFFAALQLACLGATLALPAYAQVDRAKQIGGDRKSTRLNSSHVSISYAVFCLKKKKYSRVRLPTTDQCNVFPHATPRRGWRFARGRARSDHGWSCAAQRCLLAVASKRSAITYA